MITTVAETKSSSVGKHTLNIVQRQDCKITGVIDVHAFDETNILMETVDGMLAIKGNGLHDIMRERLPNMFILCKWFLICGQVSVSISRR